MQNTLQEVQENMSKTKFTHFKSDEEMLAFYLTFSRTIYLNRVVAESSDINRL